MFKKSSFAFVSLVLLASTAAMAQTTLPVPPGATRVKLWDAAPFVVAGGKDTDTDPTEPTMDIYLPAAEKATGAAVIVFPGGGYTHLSTTLEGSAIANMLLSHNIAAFVVRYRHAPRYHYPVPILDAQRAIRTVRTNAAAYKIKPALIGVIGFSAGGHLAATVATQFDDGQTDPPNAIDKASSRPDFAILLYPVISFTDSHTHVGSRDAMAPNQPDLWPKLSAEQHVGSRTPPVFLAQAVPDRTVPVENSIMFFEACKKAGVPVEMHLFEMGGHGFGLGASDPALKVWPDLMATWMVKNHWIPAPAPAPVPQPKP